MDSFIRECGFSKMKQDKQVDLYIGRDIKEKGLYEAKHYPQTQELLIFQINEQHCKNAVATL